jgi:hypothetical protein
MSAQMARQLLVPGRTAQLLGEFPARPADLQHQFLRGPLDMDLPALIPEVPLDLTADTWLRVRGQVRPQRGIEVVDRLEQADVAGLHQVLDRLRGVPVALHAPADQRLVAGDDHLTGSGPQLIVLVGPDQGEKLTVVALGQRHARSGGCCGRHHCLRTQGVGGRGGCALWTADKHPPAAEPHEHRARRRMPVKVGR